jgi:hypothetical protein
MVRVGQRLAGADRAHYGVAATPLDVGDPPVAVGEDGVVAAGAVAPKGHRHRRLQRARGELLANHQEARHAHPLVVRGQLVPGEREAGIVPADADPGPDPDREDHRLARDQPLDRHELRLGILAEVVGVGHVEAAIRGERRPDDEVRAAARHALGGPRLRRPNRPDLLDGGGEERQRVDARALRGAVDLLDQPRRGGPGGVAIPRRQGELLAARAPGGKDGVECHRLPEDRRRRRPDRAADLAVAAGGPQDGYRRRHAAPLR